MSYNANVKDKLLRDPDIDVAPTLFEENCHKSQRSSSSPKEKLD